MLEAATERAEQVISESRDTVVPATFFDALWRSMEKTPSPHKSLKRLAARARQVRQLR